MKTLKELVEKYASELETCQDWNPDPLKVAGTLRGMVTEAAHPSPHPEAEAGRFGEMLKWCDEGARSIIYDNLTKSVFRDMAKMLRAALSAPREALRDGWISVKERLPECEAMKDENLGWLVFKPRAARKTEVHYWHPDWWRADDGSTQEVTHWRPLPAPPKETP